MPARASTTTTPDARREEQPQGFYRLAALQPDRPAIVLPTGEQITYGHLGARTNQISHALRSLGLTAGDTVAAIVHNGAEYFELTLSTGQIGMTLVPVNHHLSPQEIVYIVRDSGAKAVVVDIACVRTLTASQEASEALPTHRFVVADGQPAHVADGWLPYADLGDGEPTTPPDHRTAGDVMGYTSGTTGRPKGVKRVVPPVEPEELIPLLNRAALSRYGVAADDGVHLVCSPLYHAAPGFHALQFLHSGHTLVCHSRFDAEATLRDIERYRVTSSHMVPTHFHRLLRLPEEVRLRHDLSSLRLLIHAGAPCPVSVKRRMLDWVGPIVWEYLGSTEGWVSAVGPDEWLARPGTLGRPGPHATVKILDETGAEVPQGEAGTIYFGVAMGDFVYHNDAEKTAANRVGDLATVGDLGYFDEDGYLFLLDRRTDLIVSGGVNIYPAEIEQRLIAHPAVADVAVIGRSDPEWGQSVLAVVQPAAGTTPGDSLAEELSAFCRQDLASFKCPRTFEFVSDFPRTESGKLQRRVLRDAYDEEADRCV
ncbi:AMP-binding protein [Streptomyces sp. NPDC051985]|uniref:AMP-binding protein n=1 Tax=Streptomyces sp. NPDC051985 TaxID=3155807 RepID=UPI0034237595